MDRNRYLRSNTKLTEFAPLSPEANEPGVGFQLLSKFFSFNKDVSPSDSVSSTGSNTTAEVSTKMSSNRKPPDSSGQSQAMAVSYFPVNISEGRSLPNVLKRISNLLALKSNSLQSYKDTDFKQYWMPDSVSRECYDCEEKFTTFRRRHHCRVCGQIFCSKCCNQEIPGKIMGCTGDLRVCTYCCKVVLSYLQSSDMGADLTSDLRALQEDLQTKFGSVATSSCSVSIAQSSTSSAVGSSATGDAQHEGSVPRRKLSVGFQEDKFALGRAQGSGYLSMEERCLALQKSASLRTLFEDLSQTGAGVALQTHRFRLRNYHGCFLGSELVDWLIAHSRAGNRLQGAAIGQALTEAGYLEPIAERGFADGYTLYRPREVAPASPGAGSLQSANQSSHDAPEPLWVKQIPQQDSATTTDSESEAQLSDRTDSNASLPSSNSTFYLDLNVEDSVVHVSRPKQAWAGGGGSDSPDPPDGWGRQDPRAVPSPPHECPPSGMPSELLVLQSTRSREEVPASGWHRATNLRTENGELEAYSRLSCAFKQHELSLCKQLLNAEGLSQNWLDVVVPLCRQIVDSVRPDVRNEADEMDIRQYVQLKKVPGGSRADSRIVSGVVCTKNVAHRGMSVRLVEPRILLLGCSIVYQRIEGRLMTIEPVMMQEHEYLRNVVQRISALRPDLILVHRAVSRLAQDFFLALKVTLALHVKASVLERVARLTHADIATSVDAHVGRPRLGTCGAFHLETFPGQRGGPSKTLMFFEDCAFPHLGCTVLLRGAPHSELARVKRVARRMLFARYNWRLEKSFLMDEFARPPSPPTDSFFEQDESSKRESSKTEESSDSTAREESSTPEKSSDGSSLDSPKAPMGQSTPLKVLPSSDGRNTSNNNLLNLTSNRDNSRNNLHHAETNSGITADITTDNKSALTAYSHVATEELGSRETESESGSVDGAKPASKDSDGETCDARLPARAREREDRRAREKAASKDSDSETCDARLPARAREREDRRAREKAASEDKRANVAESVSDFSDPLHQYMNLEDEVFAGGQQAGAAGVGPAMAVAEMPMSNRFRKALDDTVLSVSPFLKFSVPHLETEQGRNCTLRQYFPAEVFSSAQFCDRPAAANSRSGGCGSVDNSSANNDVKLDEAKLLPKHPLVSAKLTDATDSDSVQTLLAAYRACGGRIPLADEPPASARSVSVCEEPCSAGGTAAGAAGERDALDPDNHQKLAVLFCSYSHRSPNAPAFCVNPWVVHMDFYGRNDIPLGSFLERYCFRPSYVCPSETCDAPMLQHVRRFVHGTGCVHIALKQLDKMAAAAVEQPGHVLMWSWCTRCQQASPVVPMSTDTWGLSFAKYLELRFHGSAYTLRGGPGSQCCHSLHHDHYQYFGYKNVVASFKYTEVAMWEVSLPPPTICIFYDPRQQACIIDEIKRLALQGYDVYSSVLERICALGNEVEGVSQLKQQRSHEHAILKSCIEEIQLKLTSPTLESKKLEGKIAENEVQQLMWRIEDAVVQLRLDIADAVCSWNARIQDFVASASRKREDKSSRKSAESGKLTVQPGSNPLEASTSSRLSEDSRLETAAPTPCGSGVEDVAGAGEGRESHDTASLGSASTAEGITAETVSLETSHAAAAVAGDQRDEVATHDIPQPAASTALPLPDISMMSSFESTTSDGFEAQRASQILKELTDEFAGSTISQPHSAQSSPRVHDSHSDSIQPADESHDSKQSTQVAVDKKSVKTIIMSQLRPSSHVFTPIQCPLGPQEHHLPVHGCVVPTIVYENEPSSIIAYALGSPDYRRSLDDIRFKKSSSNEQAAAASPLVKRKSGSSLTEKEVPSELTASVESRRSTVLSFLRGSGTNGISPVRTGIVEGVQCVTPAVSGEPAPDPEEAKSDADKGKGSKHQQSNLYIEVQFSDATANFFCRVYFAEPFAALRQMVLPAGEVAYVRSLARCVRWAARGGKSGSTFCKTRDDRFILKEMSRHELQLFLESAPHYFSYVMRCHAARQPTLLGKIVGVYRVVYRNTASNASMKTNLLVMENLFYARSVTHKFDLKGSVRNRLVNPATDDQLGEIVLLDENLLKMTCESPLYMLPHSEAVLTQAIDNDTQFLAAQEVMDYSLLVGLDQDRRELVVGIIDYIRTFTWDKKLETMVKSSGILGGQGKLPTVVSPELYRARFIASMHQYFLPVPDRWTGLGKDLELT